MSEAKLMRDVVHKSDAETAIDQVRTIQKALDDTVPSPRETKWLIGLISVIALIITNCIVLGRQEAFASRQPVGLSILDALGNGTGFTIALLLMGIPREVLGNGTFLGVHVMPRAFEPWVVMLLPPGGFFMIGVLLLVANWHALRARARAATAAAAPTPGTRQPAPEPEAALV